MDIKRNFFANPMYPVYAAAAPAEQEDAPPLRWHEFPGGIREIGHSTALGEGVFAFDNEQPRHKVFLRDYRLASRPVNNGEHLEFVEAAVTHGRNCGSPTAGPRYTSAHGRRRSTGRRPAAHGTR